MIAFAIALVRTALSFTLGVLSEVAHLLLIVWREHGRLVATVLAALLACLALVQCGEINSLQKANGKLWAWKTARQEADSLAGALKHSADIGAAAAVAGSNTATAQTEKDLKDADDSAPSALPSRARLLASCEWMRQQGVSAAEVSRCRASPTRD